MSAARALRLAGAAAVAAMAGGCVVGPDFHAPPPPRVSGYGPVAVRTTACAAVAGGESQRFHPGEELPGRWWTAFQAPQIDALVQRTLAANPDLQAAKAALRAALESAAAQRGAYFPQLSLAAGVTRQQDALGTLSPTLSNGAELFTLHTAQVEVSYPLDLFGANRRAVEALVAQADAARFQMEAAYLTLVSNTIVAAISEAAAQTALDGTRQVVQSERDALDILRRQYQIGALSMAEISAQQAALAQSEAAVPSLTAQLRQQHDLMAVLTGRFPAQMSLQPMRLAQISLPRDLPLSVPARLVEQRPDVRIAEAQLHAATAQVGIAIANMLPQISLTGDAGAVAVSLSHLVAPGTRFWSLGATLSQTLFAGGSLEHRKRAAVAQMDQAAAQYRSTVLQAFRQVADVLAALQADAASFAAQTRAVQAATQTLNLTTHNLQLGAASELELLDAQRGYSEAVAAQAAAHAARLTDTVALFEALGGGWWSPDAPVLTAAPLRQPAPQQRRP